MAEVNVKLRLAIYSKWPTMLDASKEIGIDAASLSLLVRQRRDLTATQRKKLRRHFSGYQIRKMFSSKRTARVEGATAVND